MLTVSLDLVTNVYYNSLSSVMRASILIAWEMKPTQTIHPHLELHSQDARIQKEVNVQ